MALNNILIFAVATIFILHVGNSCTETKNQFQVKDDCTPDTSGRQNIFLYTNTTIAQTITFCQISDSKQYNSIHILLNSEALNYQQIISDFRYTFNLYYFNEWISSKCNTNIYDQQLCTISPIISFKNTATLAISSIGKHNTPHITIDFPNILTINNSYSYTSLIWTLHINQGMDANTVADNIYFLACDLTNNNNNAQYIIYPHKYNTNDNNSTVFISTLSETCTEKMDNTLTELNPYTQCNSGSQITGFKFGRIGDSMFQYFAVTQTKTIYGVDLYFEIPPHSQSGSECVFTASMRLFELDVLNGNEIELTGIQDITISGLESSTATVIQFIFNQPIIVTINNGNRYFFFEIKITNGITGGTDGSGGGGEPGPKQPPGGTSECGIAMLLCYGSSYMKTGYIPYGQTIEICKDAFMDSRSGTEFKNVDIVFDLVTVLPTDSTTSTILPSSSFYTTYMIETLRTELENQELENAPVEFEESQALFVTAGILLACGVLLVIIAYLCAKYTKADNFVYSSVFIFVIHAIDVFSDIFFCISLITDHVLVTSNGIFLILAICSLLFIIAPMAKNFYDLIKFQKETQNHPLHGDRYRAWLSSFGTTLLVFSLISGSTFGTMKLMNSNLLGLRMFSMGLCLSHLREYHSHRMVNVVLMENLPQLIIQIVFTAAIPGKVPLISILAAITSVCSIIVAIVDHFSQKEIRKQAVPSELFTFKITSKSISFKPKKYRNRQKKVSKGVAKILEVVMTAVEILTIDEYSDQNSDGLIIYFLVTTIKYESDDIHSKLQESIHNGLMLRNMKKAWYLTDSDQPRVFELKWLQIQSVPTNDEKEGNTLTNTTHINTTEMVLNTTIKLSDVPSIQSQKSISKKKTIVVIADEETVSNDKKGNDEQISPMPSPMINDAPSNDSDFPKMEDNITNSDLV
eukprot:54641_1